MSKKLKLLRNDYAFGLRINELDSGIMISTYIFGSQSLPVIFTMVFLFWHKFC